MQTMTNEETERDGCDVCGRPFPEDEEGTSWTCADCRARQLVAGWAVIEWYDYEVQQVVVFPATDGGKTEARKLFQMLVTEKVEEKEITLEAGELEGCTNGGQWGDGDNWTVFLKETRA